MKLNAAGYVAGSAFVYYDDGGGQYELIHEIEAPDEFVDDNTILFGVSVDMEDGVIIVGSLYDDWKVSVPTDPHWKWGAMREYYFPPQKWNHHSQIALADEDVTEGEFDTTPEEYEDFEEDWNGSTGVVYSAGTGIGSFGGGNSQEDFDDWTSEMQW
jgi:hypothetical protein